MRVFVAGGSGTIGLPLVRALVAAGHDVTALTRSAEKQEELRSLGASVAVADALHRDALIAAVVASRPTHVIHQLTALPKAGPRQPRDMEPTNRLRIEGTRNLLDAAINASARRIVVGSFALLAAGDPARDPAAAAVQSMEEQVLAASRQGIIEGVVLRFGVFHGEGVPSATMSMATTRSVPLIHIADAVLATVRALSGAAGSIYYVVDDTGRAGVRADVGSAP